MIGDLAGEQGFCSTPGVEGVSAVIGVRVFETDVGGILSSEFKAVMEDGEVDLKRVSINRVGGGLDGWPSLAAAAAPHQRRLCHMPDFADADAVPNGGRCDVVGAVKIGGRLEGEVG
ncbi:hypothetical protein Dimus_029517 [Dionaea muscipula]